MQIKDHVKTLKRWPPAIQGKRPQEKPNLSTFDLKLTASRTWNKNNSVFLRHQSMVFVMTS